MMENKTQYIPIFEEKVSSKEWLKLRNSELEKSNLLLSNEIVELRRAQEEMQEAIKTLKGIFSNE